MFIRRATLEAWESTVFQIPAPLKEDGRDKRKLIRGRDLSQAPVTKPECAGT